MTVFGPAVGDLMTTLAAQGVEPVGAVFAHHLKMTPDAFDFELGVKVAAPVKANRTRQTGRASGGKGRAYGVQRSYEGLPSAWADFDKWIRANGHEQAEDLWEVYSVGPQSTPMPANWRTELSRPLAD